jgi:hypothetical protein
VKNLSLTLNRIKMMLDFHFVFSDYILVTVTNRIVKPVLQNKFALVLLLLYSPAALLLPFLHTDAYPNTPRPAQVAVGEYNSIGAVSSDDSGICLACAFASSHQLTSPVLPQQIQHCCRLTSSNAILPCIVLERECPARAPPIPTSFSL